MPPEKIIVTGANGQLGKELQAIAVSFPAYHFIFLSKDEFRIDDPVQVQEVFSQHHPAYCINCAAYTLVDKAETEREQAFLVNGESVGRLSGTCRSFRTRLIHISTDYVFDGNASRPFREEDPASPVNTYGASKLAGEKLALENNPDTMIIRTAWLYSSFGNNFVKTMIRLMKEKKTVRVVNDQIGSPTYAAGLAMLIMHIIGSKHFVPGIYHYSNEGQVSWYGFALAIREITGIDCEVIPIPSSQYPTPARRPQYSLLDKTKIKTIYPTIIPDWRSGLITCINQLKKQEAYNFII